jgi:hypothetical protein
LLIPAGAYFILSAQQEEFIMLQQFPEQFAAYMARTGMLVPRLFEEPVVPEAKPGFKTGLTLLIT